MNLLPDFVILIYGRRQENMKLTRVLFACLLVTASCSIPENGGAESRIIGEWGWIRSTGGFAGHTISPDSSGYSERQIIFTDENVYYLYRADTLFRSGIYSLGEQGDVVTVTYTTNSDAYRPDQHVEFNTNDTLILSDRCADCYRNVYVRTEKLHLDNNP